MTATTTPTTPDLVAIARRFCADEDTKYALARVRVTAEAIVATDGRHAIYIENRAGLAPVDETGLKFPAVAPIVTEARGYPAVREGVKVAAILAALDKIAPVKDTLAKCKADGCYEGKVDVECPDCSDVHEHVCKECNGTGKSDERITARDEILVDLKAGFSGLVNGGPAEPSCKQSPATPGTFLRVNAIYLGDALDAMRDLGIETFDARYLPAPKLAHPLALVWDGGVALLMGVMTS